LRTAAMKLKNLPGNRRGFDEKTGEGKNAAMKLENPPGNRRGFDAKARGKEETCAGMTPSIPGSCSCLRASAGEDCGRIRHTMPSEDVDGKFGGSPVSSSPHIVTKKLLQIRSHFFL
jgi:hypothetical protein